MHVMDGLPLPIALFLIALSGATLTGCSTQRLITHHNESFTATNTYSRSFPGPDASSCEAARRALLSQGYVINDASASQVDGKKKFQPENDLHVQIEFHIVCAPNSQGSNSTTVFVNAIRDTYTLKKSSNSASIGVGALGSLSLPIGSIDESLVKIGSETIPSSQFYNQFFELVERYLDVKISPDSAVDTQEKMQPDTPPASRLSAGSAADAASRHLDNQRASASPC